MKGIISNHSAALTKYQRQTAVDPVAAPQSPATRQTDATGSPASAANVSFSARAMQLAEGPGVLNSQKIEALRQSLQSGSLSFNSTSIAESMLDQAE